MASNLKIVQFNSDYCQSVNTTHKYILRFKNIHCKSMWCTFLYLSGIHIYYKSCFFAIEYLKNVTLLEQSV